MVLGTVFLALEPEGGGLLLLILVLLGVQAAIFSPAKYGILPEILPHEQLSASNGWLEMATNVAILAGTVGGGILISLSHGFHLPLWIGGVLLSGLFDHRPARGGHHSERQASPRIRRGRGHGPLGVGCDRSRPAFSG